MELTRFPMKLFIYLQSTTFAELFQVERLTQCDGDYFVVLSIVLFFSREFGELDVAVTTKRDNT